MHHDDPGQDKSSNRFWKVVFIGFALVAAFFLVTEHRAHLFGILPYLLLAACPLMHIFGHRHGGHGKDASRSETPPKDQDSGQTGHDHH